MLQNTPNCAGGNFPATGNMGPVARAMKTMGLTNLWLVKPLVKTGLLCYRPRGAPAM